jgi:opacity protein-like surface antigen
MKRTLLASAFAVMALAASAQISEVTKVKGDGFDFIPKGLTTTGVITPYSTIGVEYHGGSNQISEFTVYDASFNVEKTFKYDPRVFKSNLVPMKALADQTAFPATSHYSVRQIPKVYLILAANARS